MVRALTTLDLPEPALPSDENADRLGKTRRLAAVAQGRGADVRCQLRLRDAQAAAIEIDGRASHLADIRSRELPGELIADVGIKMLGDLLARFLCRSGDGIDQPHKAPEVVGLFGHADGRTPPVDFENLTEW